MEQGAVKDEEVRTMGREDVVNNPYNGWENKWTRLLHLHLSNEACLMVEITELVAQEPNDGTA